MVIPAVFVFMSDQLCATNVYMTTEADSTSKQKHLKLTKDGKLDRDLRMRLVLSLGCLFCW